jgi:Bacterial extracellular solute-binding proteins, family 5 Middle/PilZ domain
MEQRVRRRKPVLWSARLHRDGRVLECQTLHISAGGARIRISERFAINSTVVLVIDRVGVFSGEIRRQEDDYAGVSSWTMCRRWRRACALLCLNPWTALQLVPWPAPRRQSCPPWRASQSQQAAVLVHGAAGLLARQHGAADGHDQGDDPVDALCRLVLGGPEIARGVLSHGDVGGHPTRHRVAAVGELARDHGTERRRLPGEIDLMYPVPLQDIRRLQSEPNVEVLEGPELRTILLGMDLWRDELLDMPGSGKNPFKDQRVRQAFAHAIDLDAIQRVVMRGASTRPD